MERLSRFSQGRQLEVSDRDAEVVEGRTNYICVSRSTVLQCGTRELLAIEGDFDCRLPLEVDFFGEGRVYTLL